MSRVASLRDQTDDRRGERSRARAVRVRAARRRSSSSSRRRGRSRARPAGRGRAPRDRRVARARGRVARRDRRRTAPARGAVRVVATGGRRRRDVAQGIARHPALGARAHRGDARLRARVRAAASRRGDHRATDRSRRSAREGSCGPATRSRPRGWRPTRGSAPPRAARETTRRSPRRRPSVSVRSAGCATATPHQRDDAPHEQRDHPERDQVAQADRPPRRRCAGTPERRASNESVRLGFSGSGPGSSRSHVALAHLDLDRGLGDLILQEAQPPLDVLDLQLDVVDQAGEPQDLVRARGVRLQIAQQVAPVLQDVEPRTEIDELGRDVLPADVLELDLRLRARRRARAGRASCRRSAWRGSAASASQNARRASSTPARTLGSAGRSG